MPHLEVEGITKTFGDETAVNNLSIDVERGQFKSLLGPSGCGKTTTLRSVAGLEMPEEGQISIDGEVVFDREQNVMKDPEQRDIGMVFQSYAVWPHMSVYDNVSFPLEMEDTPKAEREDRIMDILETVGLDEHANDLATHLSGGQQQRVAIARSLVVQPEIILFDEPLASLDAKLRRELRMEIKRICDEVDITVLYVTHSQSEAMYLSDDIAVMNDGEVIEEGRPTALYESPRKLFTMQFMGQTNVLSARITSVTESGWYELDTEIGSMTVSNAEEGVEAGDDGIVTLRPKFIELHEVGVASVRNAAEGTVEYIAPTQDFVEYEVAVDGVNITAKTSTAESFQTGDGVKIGIDAGNAKVWNESTVPQQAVEETADGDADEQVAMDLG